MRAILSMISLMATLAIGMGIYYMYLKHASPGGDRVATQAISTTGVQTDLMAIAQAERVYFAQNGSYGSMDQLVSGGAMNITRTERDGYEYSVNASPSGFTVTASHLDSPAPTTGGAPLHYPTYTVDESMQVREGQ
jgi:hypothetical protein